MVLRRKYNLPIVFATQYFVSFDTSKEKAYIYAADILYLLTYIKCIYNIMIDEHRAMYEWYIDAKRTGPLNYQINDIIFVRNQTQSNTKKGVVDTLSYASIGPWELIKKQYSMVPTNCNIAFKKES